MLTTDLTVDERDLEPISYFRELLRVSGIVDWDPIVAEHMADEMTRAEVAPRAGDVARLNSAAIAEWLRANDLRDWQRPHWHAKA